ncbi:MULTISPECIES: hypothetical protein [unclassified Psychrobacter]|uniref:hypothetical protein n=1 Tax=unclassified Psychrobacter TaxID=196806 RepID=UPI000EDDD34B|nr:MULTISPECIES: hypothetical protein [unclassified Psychrobacter]HCI77079.1 hypothetical protein [Psychrobacter sp.]
MYKKNIYINNDFNIVAETDYDGEVAFYLKNKGKFIEKKFYDDSNIHKFKSFPETGALSVVFFFKLPNGQVLVEESEIFFLDRNRKSIWPLKSNVIAENKDFKITYYDQKSDITFITFNGAHSNKSTVPFGFQYIISRKWNLISVAQDNNTQYQSLSLSQFCDSVSPFIKDKRIFSYGSSLGGYCALYYGGSINATIIAASPRNSAHPLIADNLWKDLDFKHKDIESIPLTTNPVYIIYDSNIGIDTKFINTVFLPYYPTAKILALPQASHNVLKCMLDSKVLTLYISKIIEEKYDENLAKYIKATCCYKLKNYDLAFNILDDLVVDNLLKT